MIDPKSDIHDMRPSSRCCFEALMNLYRSLGTEPGYGQQGASLHWYVADDGKFDGEVISGLIFIWLSSQALWSESFQSHW